MKVSAITYTQQYQYLIVVQHDLEYSINKEINKKINASRCNNQNKKGILVLFQ